MPRTSALALLLPVLGCASNAPSPPLSTRAPGANILLICVDTLRADALGTYGQPLPTSPAIDQLAAGSVVFERAWTQYTWTLPSFVSYMTSSYARTHGWRAKMAKFETYPRMDTDLPTLAGTLRAAGWVTNAQVGNGHLIKDLAFDQGFDVWVNGLDRGVLRGAQADLKRWAADPAPHFLYVHFKGPHVGLLPTAEGLAAIGSDLPAPAKPGYGYEYVYSARPEDKAAHIATFRTAYHAAVWDTDVRIRDLLAAVEASGEADRTIVALFSDHGEMLGASGQMGHNRSVREEVTRVPLMVKIPGQAPARVGSGVARLIDLAPSLVDAVGVPVPAAWQGVSWYQSRPDGFTVAERDDLVAVTQDGVSRLVTEGDASAHGFDLATDPDELSPGDPPAALTGAKAAWEAATPVGSPGPLRDALADQDRLQEAARLKALGYVE